MKMDRYLILMIFDIFWWFNTAIITRIISNTTIRLGFASGQLRKPAFSRFNLEISGGKNHKKWNSLAKNTVFFWGGYFPEIQLLWT